MEKSPCRTKLYYQVIDAFRAKIPDLSPDDQKYKDVADLCEACLLATLHPVIEDPAEWILLLAQRCFHRDGKRRSVLLGKSRSLESRASCGLWHGLCVDMGPRRYTMNKEPRHSALPFFCPLLQEMYGSGADFRVLMIAGNIWWDNGFKCKNSKASSEQIPQG